LNATGSILSVPNGSDLPGSHADQFFHRFSRALVVYARDRAAMVLALPGDALQFAGDFPVIVTNDSVMAPNTGDAIPNLL
jgi:hypothetical protein